MIQRNAINSSGLVISHHFKLLISQSHIVMSRFLITDIREQIMDLNVNDSCTGT